MATHSRILAWETPWAEKLGGLQSMGKNLPHLIEHGSKESAALNECS